MTVRNISTPIDNSGDAGFRAWVAEFASELAAVGLVQTADTGQINTATVTRPTANAAGGYQVWRFNDSLQATAPIFLKIEYGSSQNTITQPCIWVTVGSGSNGAGTITGVYFQRDRVTYDNSNIPSTSTAYQSLFSCGPGYFGWGWKIGATTVGFGRSYFSISRWQDADGNPTAAGLNSLRWQPGSNSGVLVEVCYNIATATLYGPSTVHTLIPFDPANTVHNGSDLQVYRVAYITPEVKTDGMVCAVLLSEFGVGTTFMATLVGATPRQYCSFGVAGTRMGSSNNYVAALRWEP